MIYADSITRGAEGLANTEHEYRSVGYADIIDEGSTVPRDLRQQ